MSMAGPTISPKSSIPRLNKWYALFLLACIHPVTSCRAGCIFHPSMSLGSFGSSKLTKPCMQARIMRSHSFYLGIDDFAISLFIEMSMPLGRNLWRQFHSHQPGLKKINGPGLRILKHDSFDISHAFPPFIVQKDCRHSRYNSPARYRYRYCSAYV